MPRRPKSPKGNAKDPLYLPSPKEIERMKIEIRSEWCKQTESQRMGVRQHGVPTTERQPGIRQVKVIIDRWEGE